MSHAELLVDERLHADVELRRPLACQLAHAFLVVVELDALVLNHNNVRILAHLLLLLESLRVRSRVETALLLLHP